MRWQLITATLLVCAGSAGAPGLARAAPVTIDFESGAAAGKQVTNQYAINAGIAEGPTFMSPSDVGFTSWQSECGPGTLSNLAAASGGGSLQLNGCAGVASWTSTFFALGYPTGSVSYQVSLGGALLSQSQASAAETVVTTGFDTNRQIVAQVVTPLTSQTASVFQPVSLVSQTDDIAYVSIEYGALNAASGTPSGVLAAGGPIPHIVRRVRDAVSQSTPDGYLYVDDLTYDPPSSPPVASFVIGASPTAVATADGGTVTVALPITWFGNPDPTSSPVSLEATTPAGVTASFSPNPTSSGTATLTLSVATDAPVGEQSVTVTGYVDKGQPSQKSGSVTIPLGISDPIGIVNPPATTIAPCTPKQAVLTVDTPVAWTSPVTISITTPSQAGFAIESLTSPDGAGVVSDPHHASVGSTPNNGVATATVSFGAAAGQPPAAAAHYDVDVSATGYATQSNDAGTVAIETGEIDSTQPSGTVYTPRLERPGTLVRLTGAGFCPGSTVSFGDVAQPVAADSISPDGTSLTVTTPRDAVDGPLVVHPVPSQSITGPTFGVSSFRNSAGFSWRNGDWHTQLSQQMEDDLFGVDETNWNVFGWLVRKPEAYEYQTITNDHVAGGICFGMAYTSLEFFDNPAWLGGFALSGGNDTWHLDGGATTPDQSLLNWVVEQFSLQFTDQLAPVALSAATGIHGANDDINAIKAQLAAGEPVVLGLVRWSGLSVAAHTVLAYDTQDLPDGSTAVYVLNSNEPYSTGETTDPTGHAAAEITNSEVIIKNGQWTFPEGADFKGSGGWPWTGSEADMVVYPHADLPIVNGQQPKLPNVFTGLGLIIFGSAGDGVTQVSGGGGALFSNGSLAAPGSWPAGVAPLPSFTSQTTPLQQIVLKQGTTTPLSATVSRGTGGGAMALELPGLLATLRAGVHQGQLDHVRVSPHADSIAYQAGASGTSLRGTLTTAPSTSAAANKARTLPLDRTVGFSTSLARGATDTVAFAPSTPFTVAHTGPAAIVNVQLSGFAADGQPVAVQLPPLHLSAGERLTVRPKTWQALTRAPIELVTTIRGHRTSHRVAGRVIGRRFAAVAKVTLLRTGGRQRLRVALRTRRPPAGAWLSVGGTVVQGKRTIERFAPAQLSGKALTSGSVTLSLKRTLKKGSYSVHLRLLETIANGPVQGSVVSARALRVTVAGP